mmetsp:Transcript_43152/g.105561  ORF Transcript_43152/g.105561 Transcript_43152/m.105561 type:complete len:234 (-) Transcript_43152:99-800(-)
MKAEGGPSLQRAVVTNDLVECETQQQPPHVEKKGHDRGVLEGEWAAAEEREEGKKLPYDVEGEDRRDAPRGPIERLHLQAHIRKPRVGERQQHGVAPHPKLGPKLPRSPPATLQHHQHPHNRKLRPQPRNPAPHLRRRGRSAGRGWALEVDKDVDEARNDEKERDVRVAVQRPAPVGRRQRAAGGVCGREGVVSEHDVQREDRPDRREAPKPRHRRSVWGVGAESARPSPGAC